MMLKEICLKKYNNSVPPNKVYDAFQSVAEYRKSTIHISEDIVDFLVKIVKSGGVAL